MTVIFGRNVCGVRPTSPGFKTFEVKPEMCGLTQVSANMQTKYGFIQVNLKKEGNETKLALVVPKGTQATVTLGSRVTKLHAGSYHLSSK